MQVQLPDRPTDKQLCLSLDLTFFCLLLLSWSEASKFNIPLLTLLVTLALANSFSKANTSRLDIFFLSFPLSLPPCRILFLSYIPAS